MFGLGGGVNVVKKSNHSIYHSICCPSVLIPVPLFPEGPCFQLALPTEYFDCVVSSPCSISLDKVFEFPSVWPPALFFICQSPWLSRRCFFCGLAWRATSRGFHNVYITLGFETFLLEAAQRPPPLAIWDKSVGFIVQNHLSAIVLFWQQFAWSQVLYLPISRWLLAHISKRFTFGKFVAWAAGGWGLKDWVFPSLFIGRGDGPAQDFLFLFPT